MNYTHFFKTLLCGILFFAFYVCGTSQTQELGLRLAGLNNFDFIYKKEKTDTKYRRYRIGFAEIGYFNQNDVENVNARVNFAIGTENRRSINDKLLFVHGPEPFFGLGVNTNAALTNFSFEGGFGYVLGFQYNISEEFYVNIETIPALHMKVDISENAGNVYRANVGFNSNAVAVTLAYRLSEKIFK